MKKIKTLFIPNERTVFLLKKGFLKPRYILYRYQGLIIKKENALKIIECIEWGMNNPPMTPVKFSLGGQGGYRLDASCGERRFHLYQGTKKWEECLPVESYPRFEDDGRCRSCEGWGCCDCGHTGGY